MADTAVRGLWASWVVMYRGLVFGAFAAVFEPEAFTAHLQDLDMMGKPVEERARI
jgi:hypothetical protein